VAISVHIKEYTGETVAVLEWPAGANRLCAVAAAEAARYPLLAGVDEYDDTYFNARQCVPLAGELEILATQSADPDVQGAAQAMLRLVDLMRPAPGRPHHRQLIFSGD
jgi:hypothetical protein